MWVLALVFIGLLTLIISKNSLSRLYAMVNWSILSLGTLVSMVASIVPTSNIFSSILNWVGDTKTGASSTSRTVTLIFWVSVRPAVSVTVTVAVIKVVVSKSGAVAKLRTPLASIAKSLPDT